MVGPVQAASLQTRLLVCVPPLHEAVQADHGTHGLNLSSSPRGRENVTNVNQGKVLKIRPYKFVLTATSTHGLTRIDHQQIVGLGLKLFCRTKQRQYT